MMNRIKATANLVLMVCAIASAMMLAAARSFEKAPGRNGENTTPAPLSSYRVIAVENGGSISGVVRFESQFPRPERIRVSKDNEVCGTHKPAETFLVSPENKGLQNVLITVEGVSTGKASTPATAITLEQRGCAYVPHFQVAEIGPEGVTLKVVNEDGILHNIHSYNGQTTLFNIAQPKFKKELTQKLTAPGVIKVKCDVHDWMNAYIVLLKDQPYYAVTDERGQFTVAGVPAGSYTLRAWHEALGTMEKPATVTANQNTEIEFIISPKRE
ncbi:carboxypeptidase regulatory-like domain-containing protein [candidate division KSB1 bacterium]|nr:carboxypeptidase regulatory-like domain-containing protein [candidate division KSB1 bacterium]